MFGKKVKLSKEAYEKAKELVEKKGYSSLEELVEHLINREYEREMGGTDREEAEKKLKGLGYIS